MQTVIITGANAGLGFECAKAIARARQGWHIVLACRNVARGEEARQKIMDETDYPHLSVLELNLADLSSVRNFVAQFEQSNLPPLQGLINNAGVQVMQGLEYTQDGYELTFGTNHLGHFLLTTLLLDKFQEPARIIVVSSGTHDPASIEGRFNKPVFLGAKQLAKPKNQGEMTGIQRYSTSKLANLLFAYELDRRKKSAKLSVNAYDPAAVPSTNLLQSIKNPLLRWALRTSTRVFSLMGVKMSTPEISGAAMARLLLDDKLAGVSGKYFQIEKEKRSSLESYDPQLAAQLWEDSLILTR